MTTTALNIYALNDFPLNVRLRDIHPTTGVVSPLTSGTVTAFLAATDSPTATAVDASLSMSPTFLRVDRGAGVWFVFFDGAAITPAIMATYFSAGPPYLIVQQPGNIRTANVLTYYATRPALVG